MGHRRARSVSSLALHGVDFFSYYKNLRIITRTRISQQNTNTNANEKYADMRRLFQESLGFRV